MKFNIKHRTPGTTNILTDNFRDGFFTDVTGATYPLPGWSTGEMIPISSGQYYKVNKEPGLPGPAQVAVAYFDYDMQPQSGLLLTSGFTPPSGVFYVIISVFVSNGTHEQMSVTPGTTSIYSPMFKYRVVNPIYKTLSKSTEREQNQYFYRDKIDGNLKLVGEDFLYLSTIPLDSKIYITIEGDFMYTQYKGYFFKTDCKIDADDKSAEVKIMQDDLYEVLLTSLDKEFNLVKLKPALSQLYLNVRPIVQIYCAGDSVVTNYIGGTYWEETLTGEATTDNNLLVNTYHYSLAELLASIPASYAPSLSVNVTGQYSDTGVNVNGLYKITQEVHLTYYYYYVVRISDNKQLYRSQRTTNLNSALFEGINGETGRFYITYSKVYVRLLTSKLEIGGVDTYLRASNDFTGPNPNYPYVIGYNTNQVFIYDGFQNFPGEFGKVPDDAPNPGQYYKQMYVSGITGLSNPMPISPSNWKAASLWFIRDEFTKNLEFTENEQHLLKDAYEISDVISVLLRSIGSTLYFNRSELCSQFLYSETNPMGALVHSKINGNATSPTNTAASNIRLFITPKTNITNGEYQQPAQKSAITLGQVFNMLRDTLKLYWYIDNGMLRFEHVSYFQNGLSYQAPVVGYDTTTLFNQKLQKAWSFAMNKWEYEKESMPERFEYAWMDDVSRAFEGSPIIIRSGAVQKGLLEDRAVGAFTSDLDYMHGSPELVSRDGYGIIAAVFYDGAYRTPVINRDIGFNQNVSLSNGFLSFLYLHPKYHVYDLPSDLVNVNGADMILYTNTTRMRKQEITFPTNATINPYLLIKTELGNGAAQKVTINMESGVAKATIKHDTE